MVILDSRIRLPIRIPKAAEDDAQRDFYCDRCAYRDTLQQGRTVAVGVAIVAAQHRLTVVVIFATSKIPTVFARQALPGGLIVPKTASSCAADVNSRPY